MRTILGVVTAVGPALSIKMESGLTVHVPQIAGLKFGDEVEVAFDFTTQTVRSVVPYVPTREFTEADISPPEEPEDEAGEIEDIDITGALAQGDDGDFGDLWDWVLGSSPPED